MSEDLQAGKKMYYPVGIGFDWTGKENGTLACVTRNFSEEGMMPSEGSYSVCSIPGKPKTLFAGATISQRSNDPEIKRVDKVSAGMLFPKKMRTSGESKKISLRNVNKHIKEDLKTLECFADLDAENCTFATRKGGWTTLHLPLRYPIGNRLDIYEKLLSRAEKQVKDIGTINAMLKKHSEIQDDVARKAKAEFSIDAPEP